MANLQEMLKENSLLKEYIITLQKQVKANTDQRNALCKQMTNINHENVQLNRRISTQPTQAVTAALQHYQQMFKEETHKNALISQQLMLAKAENEQLVNNSLIHHRRIQELHKSLLGLKEQIEGMNKLQEQMSQLRMRLKSHEDSSVSLDLMQRGLQKERQYTHTIREEKEALEWQVAHIHIELQRIDHENQQLQQIIKKQNTEFDQARQREQQMAAKLALLNTNLMQYIGSNQQLEQQNQSLRKSLSKAKTQVQDLNTEIRQYVNQKVQSKMRKNRTENCGTKPHFQFDSAFQQLKVQIETIKSEKNEESPPYEAQARSPTYKSKQNAGLELSSPSKWRIIEGKLSLLASTQSMSRFR